jgi:hypothetical protein
MSDGTGQQPPWVHPLLAGVEGYPELARDFSGTTFGDGLYRFHDHGSGRRALDFILDAFPEFSNQVCPFGYDWLGRQFAVDSGRIEVGQPQVMLLEPGTGDALDIPASFAAFHNEVLTEYPDAALATEFFHAWSSRNASAVPLGRDQCAGYLVPLFLGGKDEVENLAVSDIQVYWSICGQLRHGTRNLPLGATINELTREPGL